MSQINFFAEDVSFKVPFPRKTTSWIKAAIRKEQKRLVNLNYIFCSDKYLLQINQEYLNHNTFTDIITFDSSEEERSIEGEIYISVDRVQENSIKLEVPFMDELHRVMIHGVLHLIGYSDKRPADKMKMRAKEDAYLSLRKK